MGSVDTEFAIALQRSLSLHRAVETGTFRGITARKLAKVFPDVVTIELSPELHTQAQERLAEVKNVQAIQGHSAEALRSLPDADGTLYFLDGHWSGGPTSGSGDQCPVLREIEAIGEGHPSDVLIIDDARMFATSPPAPNDPAQWPALVTVMDLIRNYRPLHIVTVVNDQIVAVPGNAYRALNEYGWRLQHVPWPAAKVHAVVEMFRARVGV